MIKWILPAHDFGAGMLCGISITFGLFFIFEGYLWAQYVALVAATPAVLYFKKMLDREVR